MPILISTPQELNSIRNNLSGVYELINDIDMSSFGNFTPIGIDTNTYFSGTLNGKGFKIKNLTINLTRTNVGLFGFTQNATIQNVGIENANVTSNMQNYVGILVGYHFDNSVISNCYTTGTVSGQYGVGGLVGYSSGLIQNSFSYANVTGKGRVGGLIGHGISSSAIIQKSYSTGLVTVTPDPNLYNGGLVGSHADSSKVTDSYYDTITSGQTISAGGTGKTTTEMKTQSTFTNWDFTNVWAIDGDYPFLQVFGVPSAQPKVETVNIDSYSLPFFTEVGKSQKSTKDINTFTESILSHISRKFATKRDLLTYTLPIDSSVNITHRTVRSSVQNVLSFINPISTIVERQTKTYKHLESFLKPLQADISVISPLSSKYINAYVSVLENPSIASYSENISRSYYIENPSFLEVME